MIRGPLGIFNYRITLALVSRVSRIDSNVVSADIYRTTLDLVSRVQRIDSLCRVAIAAKPRLSANLVSCA